MNKIYLFIFIIIFSNSAHPADWRFVGENEQIKIYIDKDSVTKKDELIYYWILTDVVIDKEDWNRDWRSAQTYRKADCTINRFQEINLNFYSENMAKGNLIDSWNPEPKWTYPPPDSLHMFGHRIVCDVEEILENT